MFTRKWYTRLLVRGILMLVACGTQLYGQVDSTQRDNSLTEGAWALQFSVSNNFTLSSFKGSVLSAKYQISPTRAIRFGISGEASGYRTDYPDSDPSNLDWQSFEISAAYLFYSSPHKDIFFFWGPGPLVGLQRYHSEGSNSGVDYTGSETRTNSTWTLGISTVAGVEWFATKWLSIHVEYGISGTYSWLTASHVIDRVSTDPSIPSLHEDYSQTTKSWQISGTGVWLGASIYL